VPLARALPAGEAEPIRRDLRALMSAHVGIIRSEQGLSTALSGLAALQSRLEDLRAKALREGPADFEALRRAGELGNMLTVARLITLAALQRTESRGAHFRSDYPEPRAEWQRRQELSLADLAIAAPSEAERPLVTAS
jgi:succinate dehydrogenase/fumarate reductase flavoprotein subunit